MKIRKIEKKDLAVILKIYDYAKNQMGLNNNPNQWGSNYPS